MTSTVFNYLMCTYAAKAIIYTVKMKWKWIQLYIDNTDTKKYAGRKLGERRREEQEGDGKRGSAGWHELRNSPRNRLSR